jgi:hypothetical protein
MGGETSDNRVGTLGYLGAYEFGRGCFTRHSGCKENNGDLMAGMKVSLCLMVWNELEGCEIDAIDGGSSDVTVEYLADQGIPVFF